MKTMDTLWKRIKVARQTAKLSQEELGKRCMPPISKNAVSLWETPNEKKRTSPKHSNLVTISNVTGANLDWLLTGHGPMRPGDDFTEPGPDIRGRVPLISWTTAGQWGEVVETLPPGAADDWIITTANVGPHAYAIRIRGESMQPTIPDGAIIIVDPDTAPKHRSIVVVRQNGDTEATCKRLIYEGDAPMIRPDNPAYAGQIAPLANDARIIGVVRQVIVDIE